MQALRAIGRSPLHLDSASDPNGPSKLTRMIEARNGCNTSRYFSHLGKKAMKFI